MDVTRRESLGLGAIMVGSGAKFDAQTFPSI